MEFEILYWIQQLRTPVLDGIMTAVTFLGNGGWFWIALGTALFAVPRTQKNRGGHADFPGSRIYSGKCNPEKCGCQTAAMLARSHGAAFHRKPQRLFVSVRT